MHVQCAVFAQVLYIFMKLVSDEALMMNVKKELKSEHTSRLKAAFLKALKQEQEIDPPVDH